MKVSLTADPIDPGEVLAEVGAARDGAVLLFLGTVRDHADGRTVTGLRYEAYAGMAEEELAGVVGEAARRWDTDRIAVVHRVGELGVGEIAVAIAVSTPHRAEGYEASRYIIEEIKKRIPVWKKERYADGEASWRPGEKPPPPG